MRTVIVLLFVLAAVYAFIPGLLSRLAGYRVFKRGVSEREICLTFDDGPDPVYTPELLDLLKMHGVKATFFLVGKHAEKHPDLVKRMKEEGHSIGVHNYRHRSNWLMLPGTVRQEIAATSEIIERSSGEPPKLYRPPWGLLNVFDLFAGRMPIVLWSAMPGDWRESHGAAVIARRLSDALAGGQIYLLHDCGKTFGADPGAPKQTIRALASFIPHALGEGYKFVKAEQLIQSTEKTLGKRRPGPLRRAFTAAWLLWERAFHAAFRLQPAVPDDPHSFLFYRIAVYGGQSIPLADGETLRAGDRIVELHMNNELLHEFGRNARSPLQLAIQLIRAMEKTMPALAASVAARKDASTIKAVVGTSMVNRGVEQFGFTVADLPPGFFAWATKKYLKLLLSVIHPQGRNRLGERAEMLVPKRIAVSTRELLRRYGKAAEEVAASTDNHS